MKRGHHQYYCVSDLLKSLGSSIKLAKKIKVKKVKRDRYILKIKTIHNDLGKWIKAYIGERCPDFEKKCKSWKMFDGLSKLIKEIE